MSIRICGKGNEFSYDPFQVAIINPFDSSTDSAFYVKKPEVNEYNAIYRTSLTVKMYLDRDSEGKVVSKVWYMCNGVHVDEEDIFIKEGNLMTHPSQQLVNAKISERNTVGSNLSYWLVSSKSDGSVLRNRDFYQSDDGELRIVNSVRIGEDYVWDGSTWNGDGFCVDEFDSIEECQFYRYANVNGCDCKPMSDNFCLTKSQREVVDAALNHLDEVLRINGIRMYYDNDADTLCFLKDAQLDGYKVEIDSDDGSFEVPHSAYYKVNFERFEYISDCWRVRFKKVKKEKEKEASNG